MLADWGADVIKIRRRPAPELYMEAPNVRVFRADSVSGPGLVGGQESMVGAVSALN